MSIFDSAALARARTRKKAQARGATPELRRFWENGIVGSRTRTRGFHMCYSHYQYIFGAGYG